MSYKIGLDISGGDKAPDEIFKGAVLAKKELGEEIVLIGVKEEIEKAAEKYNVSLRDFSVVDAPEKIDMGESPAVSIRKKRNSSISVGLNMLKDKKIDAFVSCGNTGAAVCASTLILGLIDGVERPGIALTMPNKKGISLIIDVGANVEPKPIHLLQYGVMASVYCNAVLEKENPTVGLLNIGEEASKGSDLMKSMHKLFPLSSLNFIGNIEGRDIFSGNCDCVVCDGVIGNVTLKVAEGCAEFIIKSILNNAKKSFLGILGLLLLKSSLKGFKKTFDYAEYGGAPLLGVDGIVIIGHGRSNSIAVKNAIRAAVKELKRDLNAEIKTKINEVCQDSRIREVLTA